MTTGRIYLDHNATAPLIAAARAAMLDALDAGGNASSVHETGRRARARIEQARAHVAAMVGARSGDVSFTSGGTEANNHIIQSAARQEGALVVSSIEHPSVLEAASEAARAAGRELRLIPCDRDGLIRPEALQQILEAEPCPPALVSVMLANNETGVIQPIAELARLAHAAGAPMHSDAAQAAGRIPVAMAELGVDYLSLSAHKMGGPHGAGAVITGCGAALHPLLFGGGQERKLRPGTENLAGIAGFGAAAEQVEARLGEMNRIKGLREELEKRIQALDAQILVLGGGADRLPNTSLLARPGLKAETIVMALDLDGAAISAGAACSSGKTGAGHVPQAMGYGDDAARAAFRVSLGPENSLEDIARFADILAPIIERMTKNRTGRMAA
ncbi:MAG: cysteine desulfurase [Hyphomicrobiales bacterium]|nr:MAG: cysteine desulfurase [Hyphomicrobiales bacterium]